MANGYVANVTLKNNHIVLTIRVNEYPPGEDLEISGHVTQNDGAFAVFNDIQQVPVPNPDGSAYVYVEAFPSQDFKQGKDVTVVVHAARVWTTVLGEAQPGPESAVGKARLPQTGQAGTAEEATSWNNVKAVTYARPSSTGNAGQSPAGDGASFQAS
jgi:hypothetical protein